MQLSFIQLLVLLAVPGAVSACEGECISGITNAFVGNYTARVNTVFDTMSREIAKLVPHHSTQPSSFLDPIRNEYMTKSYSGMETAIFPSYFHGKCGKDGVDPPGCPNPDCPVVCGTPGSLIHFYTKLRYIAFNQTKHLLQSLSTPGSDSYKQVEKKVLSAAPGPTARTLRIYPRFLFRSIPDASGDSNVHPLPAEPNNDLRKRLSQILSKMGPRLEEVCGGSGMGDTNGLPKCSWANTMKEYILSFP